MYEEGGLPVISKLHRINYTIVRTPLAYGLTFSGEEYFDHPPAWPALAQLLIASVQGPKNAPL